MNSLIISILHRHHSSFITILVNFFELIGEKEYGIELIIPILLLLLILLDFDQARTSTLLFVKLFSLLISRPHGIFGGFLSLCGPLYEQFLIKIIPGEPVPDHGLELLLSNAQIIIIDFLVTGGALVLFCELPP